MSEQPHASEERGPGASRTRFEGVIRSITTDQALAVRWPVLRAGLPRESALFAGDDAPATRHFGIYFSKLLVSVASIYRAPFPERPEVADAWQLRGMATVPSAQRQGCGSALLDACVEAVKDASGALLWCNARTAAVPFYRRHRFVVIGEEFVIAGVGPHFRMWLDLRK